MSGPTQFFAMAHYLGGNLPSEITFYLGESTAAGGIAITLVLFDFVIPFAMAALASLQAQYSQSWSGSRFC